MKDKKNVRITEREYTRNNFNIEIHTQNMLFRRTEYVRIVLHTKHI